MKISTLCMASITALAGLATPAFAQDSVSTLGGFPGDALDPWNVNQQCARYVVDLTPFQSRCGRPFTIGPIMKASHSSATFFSSLMSAQGISRTLLQGAAFPSPSYSNWTTPGPGVNVNANSAPALVSPTGPSNQIGVTFSEFGSTPARANNIIGGVLNYKPNQPTKLYVTRVNAAVNQPTMASGDFSQFGTGAVDSMGNVYYRADSSGSTGLPATDRLTTATSSIFRTRTLGRNCSSLNLINHSGAQDAASTDNVMFENVATHNTPNCIPQGPGQRAVYVGTNFGVQNVSPGFYRYEQLLNTVVGVQTHFGPAGPAHSVDHRGNLGVGPKIFPDNSVMSAAIIGKSQAHATGVVSGPSDELLVWGIDTNGNLTTAVQLPAPNAPAGITDVADGYTLLENFPANADSGFDGYHSSVAFRGGNGHIALGRDRAGRGLAAATIYDTITSGNDNPCNDIAVYRFDPASPTTGAWALAAWNNCGSPTVIGAGKPLCGPGGGPNIGQLCTLLEVTGGVSPAPIGPSISAPAFDSAGNIWFIGAVRLYAAPPTPGGTDGFTTGLIRAIYDPSNFSYKLELVFTNGQVFAGQNSGRNYKIIFLSLANQQTARGLSAGTLFNGNVMQTPWSGISGAAQDSPATLGGLVMQASIIYDRDNDGDFVDPTDTGAPMPDPTSKDEAYNVVLFLGSSAVPCAADLNGDGMVGSADLALLLGSWGPCAGCPSDLNGDGTVGSGDLALLLGSWGPCP